MKKTSFIYFIMIAVGLESCILSKNGTDKSVTKYVNKNVDVVKEAAEFSVQVTYDQTKKDFNAKDVQDEAMRKKIISLGSSVLVTYRGNTNYEIPDSSVTFKTMTLFGVTEIIYDFATTPRNVFDSTNNRQQYYFVKLADRIYYRRRLIPMM